MHTGENEHALRKILDMTRLISIVILQFPSVKFGVNNFVGFLQTKPKNFRFRITFTILVFKRLCLNLNYTVDIANAKFGLSVDIQRIY